MRQELTLSDHDARIAVEVIRAETEKRGKSAVIAVVDSRGELISLLRMDGAAFSSVRESSGMGRLGASTTPIFLVIPAKAGTQHRRALGWQERSGSRPSPG